MIVMYYISISTIITFLFYFRSQFSSCKRKILNINDIQEEKELSLRTVPTQQSLETGQGFVKCSCKTKYKSNRYGYVSEIRFSVNQSVIRVCLVVTNNYIKNLMRL